MARELVNRHVKQRHAREREQGAAVDFFFVGDAAAYFHFGSLGGRDARGCRVDCTDLAHDASGRPVPSAALA